MKFANKAPELVKSAVYVDGPESGRIALWYSKPTRLGYITRDGDYWLTEDGVRFNSSRPAIDHLIRVYEIATFGKSDTPPSVRQRRTRKAKPTPGKRKGAVLAEKQEGTGPNREQSVESLMALLLSKLGGGAPSKEK